MTEARATEPPSVEHALDAVTVGLDQLVKRVDDRALEQLDDSALIGFMHTFERLRNRLSLIDHQIIADGVRRDLSTTLCRGSMQSVLRSTLSLSE